MQKFKTMKQNAKVLFIGLSLVFFGFGCGDTTEKEDATQKEVQEQPSEPELNDANPKGEDKTGPEYTSRYICPMHCEGSGADEPGTCPVCGMDYVMNENFKEGDTSDEGHDHDHDHDHPDHPNDEG